LTLDNGVEIRVKLVDVNHGELGVFQDGRALPRESIVGAEIRSIITGFLAEKVFSLPPIGVTSSLEALLTYNDYRDKLLNGHIVDVVRNNLFWNYNDGDKQYFYQIVNMVKRYFPNLQITEPKLSHDSPQKVVVEFIEDGQRHDISSSGSGLRTLINLASVLVLSDAKILLIDEPDAHLHGGLQRMVAKMLSDYVFEKQRQVIVATHAPDFLSQVPIESLVWVDRTETEGRNITSLGRALVDLGGLSTSDAMMSRATDKVLFVEGDMDYAALSQFYEKAQILNPFNQSERIMVVRLPNGKSSAKTCAVEFPNLLSSVLNRSIPLAVLCDLDYDLENPDHPPNLIVLPRKEVENFLLDADLLFRAAQREYQRRYEKGVRVARGPARTEVESILQAFINEQKDEIKCKLTPKYRAKLGKKMDETTKEREGENWFSENWKKSEWRLAHVPGKRIIRDIRKWFQDEYQLTITNETLFKAIDMVPADLLQALKRVNGALSLT
jgi:hypothetical protein